MVSRKKGDRRQENKDRRRETGERLSLLSLFGGRVLSFYPFFDEPVNFFSMDYTEN